MMSPTTGSTSTIHATLRPVEAPLREMLKDEGLVYDRGSQLPLM